MNNKLANKTSAKLSLETTADLEHLGEIIDFTERALDELDVNDNARGHICLAIDEAATNVAMYAYKEVKGKIALTLERLGEKIIVTITDSGVPFNPIHYPPPDTTADIDKRLIGGLGIHLVRNMMDKMDYHRIDNKNRLIMEKNIGGKK